MQVMPLLVRVGDCLAADNNDVEKSIRDIKAEYESQLLAMTGVVSVGLGQDAEGNPLMIIGVESEEITRTMKLPREFQNFPVTFQVIGTVKAR